MTARKARVVNIAFTLFALLFLVSAGGRLKAYFLSDSHAGTGSAVLVAQAGEAATPVTGRENPTHEPEAKGEAASPAQEAFTWINFLLLVAAVGYLIKKQLAPYLSDRREGIAAEMRRSREAIDEAAKRLAGIEEKLVKLDQEIASLRSLAMEESRAQEAHLRESAKLDSEKIIRAAEQEIVAAGKVARQELQRYAADLAIGLAERNIRNSMSSATEHGMFATFIADLRGSNKKRIATNGAGKKRGA